MNNKVKFQALIARNKNLVNLIIILLGILLTIIGFILPNDTIPSSVLVSIGLSFLSTGLVALLMLMTIDSKDDDEREQMYLEWGIAEIYQTRSEMNSHTAKAYPNMKKEFQQIAFGVKSLRDAYDKLFIEKVKKGLKIRFITIHPNSPFLLEREKIENKQPGEIRKTIIDLMAWIEKLQKVAKKSSNVQIRFYDSLPLDFYSKIDDNLYVGPYLYGKESQQTISYRFSPIGKGYKYYNEYFETIWNDEMMKDLETVKKELQQNEVQ